MLIKTSAIVLSSLKYGDSGKIVKLYTESSGVQSFIVKSVYAKNNRKNSLLIPLNSLEIVFEDKSKPSLHHFKEISQSHHYQSLYQHPAKTSIVLFLAEVLNAVLKEEEANVRLFRFIQNSFLEFDQKQNSFADFHVWFLTNLTQFLGFYPHLENSSQYFDLTNGISTNEIPNGIFISESNLLNFEKILSLDFFAQTENQFNQNQRKSILSTLMKYYELHISDFRHPKSLDVLRLVFE